MARSIGSTTVYLGLVAIPVKVYSATTEAAGVSFNLLHKADGARLKQQYVCAKDGAVVSREDMVKGYEFAKDQYVTFSTEELKALETKTAQSEELKIEEFVRLEDVDPIYFDKPYYLGPELGAEKAYRVLVDALKRCGTGGIGQYAARGQQYLVLVRELDGRLVMHELRRTEEVRPAEDVAIEGGGVPTLLETKLAVELILRSAGSFQPEKYPDQVRARTLEVIQEKIEGKEIVAAPVQGRAQIVDLLEALKASLEVGEQRKGPKRAARGEPRPAKRASR
jgi:DNA end-binding protein Ku